jgi:hypothetical protein
MACGTPTPRREGICAGVVTKSLRPDHILSACTALSFTKYVDRHDQVARQVAKAIVKKFGVEWKTPPNQFVLKRNGKEGRLLSNPKVTTVEKVEHNHPDLILQLPERPNAFKEFTVCRDDSVVERAKFKEDKYRLGEEAQATPRRPSNSGRDEGRDSESDGSFAGEVEGRGFRHASASTAEGSSQSRIEDTQVLRLKTGGVWQSTKLPDKPVRWGGRVLSV